MFSVGHVHSWDYVGSFKLSYKCCFLLTIVAIFVSGCAATISVKEHQKARFNRDDTVTVMCRTLDPMGFTGELEHLLLSRGFDVVSQEVAIRKAKLNIDVNYDNQRTQGEVESYNTTELRSVYSLTFSYSTRFDGVFSERKIIKLYGSLIDLRTGKIVKSLKIDRGPLSSKGNSDLLEKLVDKL